jgi:hypothetical protein
MEQFVSQCSTIETLVTFKIGYLSNIQTLLLCGSPTKHVTGTNRYKTAESLG